MDTASKFFWGLYLVANALPAGERSVTHAHAFDHKTIISKGTGIFITGGHREPYRDGDVLTVKAGVNHFFEAHTDTIVVCVLPEEEPI